MEFIKTAYCITIPLLLILIWVGNNVCKKYSTNLLAVTNVLLMGHSIFLLRQMLGAYQLAKSFSVDYLHSFNNTGSMLWRLGFIIFFPFLFLHRYFRNRPLLSILLVVLLYSVFPYATWNTYDLVFKIPAYLCLLCAGYALLWLMNKLPYQSIPH